MVAKHLREDDNLRMVVDEFNKGCINPALLQGLRTAVDAGWPSVPSVPNPAVMKEGDVCLARWKEDEVWYNARVETVFPHGVKVMFTDYGNCDEVEAEFLVTDQALIPDGHLVDEHVVQI